MKNTIRIGTRGSRLALSQANWVADRLREAHGQDFVAELVILITRGDKLQHLALAKLDDKGFFTKEIEQALIDGRVDVAVHSLKDLPSEQPEGLDLAAIPVRRIRPTCYCSVGITAPIRGFRVDSASGRAQ